MTITAIKGNRGQEMALCACDVCSAEETVPASHGNSDHFVRGGAARLVLRTPAQAVTKLRAKGWTEIKGKLRCPRCEAKRKEEPPMAENEPTPIRQPTREQRRQIVLLLTDAYDTDVGRYRGADTDKTLAEAVGGGCMPGWVAEERERAFGPDGGNDDIETLRADLHEWQTDMDRRAAELHDRHVQFSADLRAFNEGRGKAADFLKRLETIKAAVGPKAARA